MDEPINIQANTNTSNGILNPVYTPQKRGPKPGSKRKSTKPIKEDILNDDMKNNKKLKLFEEIISTHETFKHFLTDYKINVTVSSDETEMMICLTDMRKIIASKQAKNIPGLVKFGINIVSEFKRMGWISETTVDKLSRFRNVLIERYSYIEPEINEIIAKYPWFSRMIKQVPVELDLLMKLREMWNDMDNPMTKKKPVNLNNKYNDL